eukprot:scaffold206556_cov23-Tisochrysis_lutea.AAC.1
MHAVWSSLTPLPPHHKLIWRHLFHALFWRHVHAVWSSLTPSTTTPRIILASPFPCTVLASRACYSLTPWAPAASHLRAALVPSTLCVGSTACVLCVSGGHWLVPIQGLHRLYSVVIHFRPSSSGVAADAPGYWHGVQFGLTKAIKQLCTPILAGHCMRKQLVGGAYSQVAECVVPFSWTGILQIF